MSRPVSEKTYARMKMYNKSKCDSCHVPLPRYHTDDGYTLLEIELPTTILIFCNEKCYKRWRTSERGKEV